MTKQAMTAAVRTVRRCGVVAIGTVIAGWAVTAGSATPGLDTAVFDQLKSLEGRWEGRVEDANATPVAVDIEVTSNGRAVIEKIFADTPHEMTTVYFLAGDRLQATHYCSIGNQPTFNLAATSKPRDITMELSGGTGFDPKTDQHAHGVHIEMLDTGQLKVEWQFRKGEASPTYARMLLARPAGPAPAGGK